jgi:hypothetical protein
LPPEEIMTPADTSLPYPDADLRLHPPRSPRERLAGLVLMARTVDKLRAKIQGTSGAYKIGPGLSQYLLDWLEITEEQLTGAVRNAKDDAEVARWIEEHCDRAKFAEINERLVNRGLRDEAHRQEVLPRYPVLNERPELRNWFDILEADDAWMFDPRNAGKEGAAAPV